MKKLISLISTKNKTQQQIVDEAWKAFEMYNQTGKTILKVRKGKDLNDQSNIINDKKKLPIKHGE